MDAIEELKAEGFGEYSQVSEMYVRPGDMVKEGERLCEIYSLPDRYDLFAESSIQIIEVKAEPGDPVSEGQVILTYTRL